MKAMFLGATEINLSGKVKGKTVTVTAKLGEVIEISEDQKALVESSGTHIFVPGLRPRDREIFKTSADKRTLERVKETITYTNDDDWFLTPIAEPPPEPPPEAVARNQQQHQAKMAEIEAEQEAERIKAEAEAKKFKDSIEASRLVKEEPKKPTKEEEERAKRRAAIGRMVRKVR